MVVAERDAYATPSTKSISGPNCWRNCRVPSPPSVGIKRSFPISRIVSSPGGYISITPQICMPHLRCSKSKTTCWQELSFCETFLTAGARFPNVATFQLTWFHLVPWSIAFAFLETKCRASTDPPQVGLALRLPIPRTRLLV
jgi:hypothetical protein